MLLDHGLDDAQPQPGAGHRSRQCGLGAEEGLEEPSPIVLRDPDAGVADLDLDHVGRTDVQLRRQTHRHVDATALGAELHSVGDQVEYRPLEALRVADDPDVNVLLELLLGSAGYDVKMARDGASALSALHAAPVVDLLILHVAMPGELDGLDVTRQVRADPAYAALPVLLLSARTQAEHVDVGMAAGATDYVIKPFDSDVLLERITALLAAP